MKATFFRSSEGFRKWLEKNHLKEKELLVGFYKVGTGKPSMTWSESVDQALCFGWIDGIRRTIDEASYSIRFTPRKTTSIWSAINIRKMDELRKAGLMNPAGEKAFSFMSEKRNNVYSHEKAPVPLDPSYLKDFKKNRKAWKFFEAQAPSYKKVMVHWVMAAKQDKTQVSRLEKVIKMSEEGKRIL